MSSRVFSVLTVLVTIVAIAAIFGTRPQPHLMIREAPVPAVTVTQLNAHDVKPWRRFSGRFEPVRTSKLKFEVSGRVDARHVEAGTLVEKGRVLLEIDDRDYRDRLLRMQAEVDLIRAEIDRDEQLLVFAEYSERLQKQEVSRFGSLVSGKLAPQSLLDAAKQRLVDLQIERSRLQHLVSVASARLDLIRSERDQAERKLQRTRLQAPFSGIVNQINVEVGGYAVEGQSALVMVDVSQLDLLLHVDGKAASELEIGRLVEIRLPHAAVLSGNLQGELVALQVAPDPETLTYEARVRVAADGLSAGTIAYAHLPEPVRDDVITVPIGAVQYLDGRTYVFVVYDGTLKRTRVLLGARIGDEVIVESGLESGLSVIAHNVDRLYDGQRVGVGQETEPIQ